MGLKCCELGGARSFPYISHDRKGVTSPVIASRIKGHIDLLGEDSPWLYDTQEQLAQLLGRAGELEFPMKRGRAWAKARRSRGWFFRRENSAA